MPETRRGDAAVLFDHVVARGLEPETLYSYEELSGVLGRSIQQNRRGVYGLVRRLEAEQQRTLICVVNEGYRVALATESVLLGDRRVRRAAQQIGRGLHTVRHTRTAELAPADRRELDLLRSGMLAVQQDLTRVKRRQTQIEERVTTIEQEERFTADEVARLRDLLKGA